VFVAAHLHVQGSGKCRHVHGIVFISDTVSDEEGKHLCGDASHRISSSLYLDEYPSYDTLASLDHRKSPTLNTKLAMSTKVPF